MLPGNALGSTPVIHQGACTPHDRHPDRRPACGARVLPVHGAGPSRHRRDHRGRARAARRHPDRRLRHRRPLRRDPALTQDGSGNALRAIVEDGRPGRSFVISDLKAAFGRFRSDEMTDHAAGLTYYSLMSLFPALLVAVAVLGAFGEESLISDTADYLKSAGAPANTVNAVTSALESAQSQRSTAITALVLGLLVSVYSASGAFAAVGRALNRVWRVEEGRGLVHRKLNDLLWTLVVLVLVLITFVLIFLGGGLASDFLGT